MDILNAIKNNNVGFIEQELTAKVLRINDTVKDKRGKHVTTPLVRACELENIEIVELLIQHNADVNRCSQSSDGCTPLYTACTAGNYDLVELLVKCGARVDQPIRQNKSSPLHTAIEQGHMDIVKYLLAKGADVDMLTNQGTPLIAAVEQSNMQFTKLLLAKGANVNGVSKTNETAIHKSVEKQYISMIELLHEHGADIDIKHHGKFTLLHTALRHHKNDSLKYVLMKTNGRDVNIAGDGKTPLAWAAESENFAAMKLLLSYKAKVNLLPVRVDNCKIDTMTALMSACLKCHRRPIELLIDQGANVNQQNHAGNTALHMVVFNDTVDITKRLKTCELLLKRHAVPTLKNNQGVSPFYYAVRKGYLPLIEIFLDNGADPNTQDELGENALHRLIHFGTKYFELLFKYRIDINKPNLDGNTPLHLAVMLNLPTNHVQMLITNGARVTRNHNGEYPIHFATTFEMIMAFARIKCSVNEQDHCGNTTLHRIARTGIEKALLKQCISSQLFDLELENNDGKTVFDIVMEQPSFELVKVVEGYKKMQKTTSINTSQNKNLQGSLVKEDTVILDSNNKIGKSIKEKKSKPTLAVNQKEDAKKESASRKKPSDVTKPRTQTKISEETVPPEVRSTTPLSVDEHQSEVKQKGNARKNSPSTRRKSSSPSSSIVLESQDTPSDIPHEIDEPNGTPLQSKEDEFSIDMEGIISSEDEFFREEQMEALHRNRYCSFYESSTSDEGEILYLEPFHDSDGEMTPEEENSTIVIINVPVMATANQCYTTTSTSPHDTTEGKQGGESEDWNSTVVEPSTSETQSAECVADSTIENQNPGEIIEEKDSPSNEETGVNKTEDTTHDTKKDGPSNEETGVNNTEDTTHDTKKDSPSNEETGVNNTEDTTHDTKKDGPSNEETRINNTEDTTDVTTNKKKEEESTNNVTANKKSRKSQIPKAKRSKNTTTTKAKTSIKTTTTQKTKTGKTIANKTTTTTTTTTIAQHKPKVTKPKQSKTATNTTADEKKKLQRKIPKKRSSIENDKKTGMQLTTATNAHGDKKNKKGSTKPTVVILCENTSFDKAIQISAYLNRQGRIDTVVYPDERNKQPDTSELQEILGSVKTSILCLTNAFVDKDNKTCELVLKCVDRSHKPIIVVRLDIGHDVEYEKSSMLDLMTSNEQREFELFQASFDEEISNLLLHIKEKINPNK